jgi:hypothetical protein
MSNTTFHSIISKQINDITNIPNDDVRLKILYRKNLLLVKSWKHERPITYFNIHMLFLNNR